MNEEFFLLRKLTLIFLSLTLSIGYVDAAVAGDAAYGTDHAAKLIPHALVENTVSISVATDTLAPHEALHRHEFNTSKSLSNKNNLKHLLFGIFLTVAIFNAIFYFCFDRHLAFVFLSAYCLIHLLKLHLVYEVNYASDVPLEPHDGRVIMMSVSAFLGSFFLAAFTIVNFLKTRYSAWLLGLVLLTAMFYVLQIKPLYILLVAIFSLGLSAYAFRKANKQAIFSVVGLSGYMLFMLLGNREIIDFGYFIGIVFFIVCMSLSFGLEFVERNRRYQASTLRSARLENELLKKNIQPHFIMNSLMCLQELLVKNPTDAGEFIDSLAGEFKGFSAATGKKLIDIQEEIRLCEAHLNVMGWRKNSNFTLESSGIDGSETIPPGVFHTLVENGITHGYEHKRHGRFFLTKDVCDFGLRYILFNDGNADNSERGSIGTGLKYVESRLQESYPDRWKLLTKGSEKGWRVEIEIHNKTL